MNNSMQWVSTLSTRPSLEAAVGEVVEQAQQKLRGRADLGIVFISSAFLSDFPRLLPLLQEKLPLPVLVGCGGGGIVGTSPAGQVTEVESGAALSLNLAHLPGVEVHPFYINTETLPDPDGPPDRWIDLVGVSPQDQPQFILFASPFASGLNDLIQGLDYAYPKSVKVGGLTSVASTGNQSGLFFNHQLIQGGVVGVALSGNVVLDAIVAQGCRPVGDLCQVVEGDRNIVISVQKQAEERTDKLAVQPPLQVLQDLVSTLSPEERELAQTSLSIGIAQNEFKARLEQGDFLIRTLMGVDPRQGAIAIGDRVRPGMRIQFHLRDAHTSMEDLEGLLQRYLKDSAQADSMPLGALMFVCIGRGQSLYEQPNVDSALLRRYLPSLPLSGFFCNGEIGPVGETTFIHGFTSVFGIIRQPNDVAEKSLDISRSA
ncbi:MAG: FIST C-terminal domain-containing protein [Synechococcales bacterium]|nr:FIST C-terminal domain-containing protein [Synechococcales bacterium]